MALDTITIARLEITKIYIAAFNRAPDAAGLSNWMNQYTSGKMTYKQISEDFSNQAEYTAKYPSAMTNSEYITKIYLNVFGRTPDAGGLTNWVNQLDASATTGATRGNIMKTMLEAAGATGNADGIRLTNQATFAVQAVVVDGISDDVATAQLANITSDPATVDTATAAVAGYVGGAAGETFTLTTGSDKGAAFTGGAGNDTFNADVDLVWDTGTAVMVEVDTLQATDNIDGGAGINTLNLVSMGDGATAIKLGTLTNIQKMNVQGLDDLKIDTSAVTDLTNLNVTKMAAGKTLDTKANDTTDINVSMKAAGAAVAAIGGKDVTVKLTDVATTTDAVTVGVVGTVNTATDAAGNVVVEMTGKAVTANATLSAINVTGGDTISITQKATSDASKAATGNMTITQGAVTVTANTSTTDVTVKQDATVAVTAAANTTGGVTETASIKFSALTAGQTIILGGLTMTADTAMTANEAAAAFANLAADAAKGTLLAGDTQSAGVYTKATYTGNFSGWTSGAATGDTVVFTNTTANSDQANLANTGTGTVVVTTTAGKAHDATMAGGVMGITTGVVDVAGSTALKTVTVDGYDITAAAATNTISGATNTALETINLSNGGGVTVTSAAATLALNLEKVVGKIAFTTAPATLNIKSTGDNNIATLTAAATTALNVSGTGTLGAATSSDLTATKTIVVTETAGLNLTGATLTALESVNTAATTGTVTMTIKGANTTYTGGAGNDIVTISDANTAIAKAIDLGNGDNKLILTPAAGTTAVPTVTLKAGTGTDTLSLDAASAAVGVLSANATFAAKVTGFERLEITGATGAQAVNVANLGLANYVTVAGTAGTTTLNDLANNATVVINAAVTTGVVTNIKDADDAVLGTADVLNLVITNAGTISAGTVTAADIETINLTVTDSATAFTAVHTMVLTADTATTLTVDGNAGLGLTLTGSNKLTTINASGMTDGALTVTANGANVMTITGGKGADVLTASATKADVLNGGDGADTLTAGFNGAKLTGGTGNDLFVVGADSAVGNTESNTYSYIKDFSAGDKIQLAYFDTDTDGVGTDALAPVAVASLTKLAASLDESTASFSNFVTATFAEMTAEGQAIWFSYGGHSYIVVDNNVSSDTYVAQAGFVAGEDLIVRVENVDLTGASFNSDYGTIEIA
ncbi:MAG: DUF4214 domain-containing protein [Sulfurimonas sp.]|nr:DUF4214 domain-containing protein [Sulfurimonas sp.]